MWISIPFWSESYIASLNIYRGLIGSRYYNRRKVVGLTKPCWHNHEREREREKNLLLFSACHIIVYNNPIWEEVRLVTFITCYSKCKLTSFFDLTQFENEYKTHWGALKCSFCPTAIKNSILFWICDNPLVNYVPLLNLAYFGFLEMEVCLLSMICCSDICISYYKKMCGNYLP